MITVSATDQNDNLASFSSWGPMVDVAAPGVTVQTTLWNSGYGWGTGTSFATPVVAGTVALIMSANPALAPADIENVLFSTATNLGAAGYDYYFGWGRVNAAAAVAAAGTTTTTTDTTPPTVAIASPTGGTVSGIVPVSVSAADNVGVTKVELWVGGVLLASDTVAPWSFSWDTTKIANATYAMNARAYDAVGHMTSSAYVNVTVANGTLSTTTPATADTTPPVAHVSYSAGKSKLRRSVTIQGSATDNVAVTSLSISIDGAVKATSNSASLSYSWSLSNVASGSHLVTVLAKDAAGNAGSASTTIVK
jgi:hypothetical protein